MSKAILGQDAALRITQTCLKSTIIRILKYEKVAIGSNCDLNTPLFFHNVTTLNKLEIGNDVHIGKNCFFDLTGPIKIGSNSTISMCCLFVTHLDVGKNQWQSIYPGTSKGIVIGEHVYIGANSQVLQGCTIANSVFIGANSLVIKDISEAGIYFGQPVTKKD